MTEKPGRFASLETQTVESSSGRGKGAVVRDVSYYMKAGLERELDGDHESALKSYSAALGEDPLHIEAWTRQLWMLVYLDEPLEAEIWADKAMQYFPSDPDILSLKSLALWRIGSREEARELNDAALAAARDSANVWLARGAFQAVADGKSAGACFAHALRLHPVPGLANLRAGDLLLYEGKYAEAFPYCREATVRFPESSWAWYGYGRSLVKLGRSEQALVAFKRAYALKPRDRRYKAALKAKASLWAKIRYLLGWNAG